MAYQITHCSENYDQVHVLQYAGHPITVSVLLKKCQSIIKTLQFNMYFEIKYLSVLQM